MKHIYSVILFQKKIIKKFISSSGEAKDFEVELFTWEKTDMVDKLKSTAIKGA